MIRNRTYQNIKVSKKARMENALKYSRMFRNATWAMTEPIKHENNEDDENESNTRPFSRFSLTLSYYYSDTIKNGNQRAKSHETTNENIEV